MRQYYISDGENIHGPITFDDLIGYRINEKTLIWYKGLEKWKLAKNIPELVPIVYKFSSDDYLLIIDNKFEGPLTYDQLLKMNIKPDTLIWFENSKQWKPVEGIDKLKYLFDGSKKPPKIEDQPGNTNYNKFFIILISFFAIVITLVIIYDLYNANNQKSSVPPSISKKEIKNLLGEYYDAQENKNYKEYQSFYQFPIKRYFDQQNLKKIKFEKLVKDTFSKTSNASNIPNYDKLEIQKENDSIYEISYPLIFKYTLTKNNENKENKYRVKIKINKRNKIKYIQSTQIKSKKGYN